MDNRREGKVGLRTGPRGKLNNIVGFFFSVGRLGGREFWGGELKVVERYRVLWLCNETGYWLLLTGALSGFNGEEADDDV